jgi:basic membrane protein A and related proteins
MTLAVNAILVGHRNDRGFVQAGYEGLLRAKDELGLELTVSEHHAHDATALEAEVAAAARSAAAVIVHGSRADAAIEANAAKFPGVRFFSAGGYAEEKNVWNYALLHYQAAFLAGVIAARLTTTGIVGHLSGVPIAPGKRGRAAYAHGVRFADPKVRVVTGFCGNQDQPELARKWTEGEIAEGVDVIFTMLNFGRIGAIEACRAAGVKQIGNISDWPRIEPDVFVASAIADHGWSIRRWLQDLVAGKLEAGINIHAGLESPDAVRLALGGEAEKHADEIRQLAARIVAGEIQIAPTYEGPEFSA